MKNLLLLIILLLHLNCGAQNSVETDRVFSLTPVQVKESDLEKISFVIPLNPVDSVDEYEIPELEGVDTIAIYAFKSEFLLPTGYDKINIPADFGKPNNILIVFKEDHCIIIQDTDSDRDFTDESKRELTYRDWQLLYAQQEGEFLTGSTAYPFALKVEPTDYRSYRVEYSSLIRYKARLDLGSDTLSLLFSIDPWRTRYSRIKGESTDAANYFLINEPFLFQEKYYSVTKFDLARQEILFHTYEVNEELYGYRKGYSVDLRELKRLSNKSHDESWTWSDSNYYLLHFWGPWCPPCLKELPQLPSFRDSLRKLIEVEFINYAVFMLPSDRESFDRLYRNDELISPQIIQPESTPESRDKIAFRAAQSAQNLLKIDQYPTFVLTDSTGVILYRGIGADKHSEILNFVKNLK